MYVYAYRHVCLCMYNILFYIRFYIHIICVYMCIYINTQTLIHKEDMFFLSRSLHAIERQMYKQKIRVEILFKVNLCNSR